MPIYPLMLPLFAAAIIIGALIGWAAWRNAELPGSRGAILVGAGAGAGPLLTMYPLQACTFEPGRTNQDIAVGVLAFAAGAAVIAGIMVWIGRALSKPGGVSNLDVDNDSGTFRQGASYALPLLAPTLIVIALFLYWPLFETLRLSTLLTQRGSHVERFVCVDNYTRLLGPTFEWWLYVPLIALAIVATAAWAAKKNEQDSATWLGHLRGWLLLATILAAATSAFGPAYRSVFVTTLILTSGVVVFSLVLGLAIAMLVSQPIRGRGIYRTLLIWPFALSPPIAGILFFVMFDPVAGIVGNFYETLTGLDFPNYRHDPTLARALVIVASVWKTLGFTILFYIAGLQNVSREMLEAARVDGAGPFKRLWYFIIPSLTPITFFLIVTQVTYAFFEVFGTINYLTGGGPSGATTDALTAVWLSQEWIGDGAARSLVLFAMVLAVTAWQFHATGRRVHYGR
ncbi:carbohydrate ABC transporter permease [Natronoglycomyces albus]|uniref:Sugar ABC transporter permease n=1 Tax=Natronoglycomyces albus TaxID=2811108 RepID=A0A895XQI4_9ACTN|nr:sugar ABC transporter permease [Natronoglycomyces albus]QSB05972.1 sugar ABC transporter permease [Natronoglycomyces albus]